ncbi:MAG TPA: DNA adenine methylase, partial [Ilumatobacteraceae bacterium]|nr:DNA adenine methylase [Ilumatobacteraceae bacterium]
MQRRYRRPSMIKYLGSKRRLVPVLGRLLDESGAQTALDLFTGTTRVAQEFKRHGAVVTAVDLASYSDVFARCWIGTDAGAIDTSEHGELHAAIGELNALEGTPGYVTETFCHASRFFQPKNGARIDAIRDAIARKPKGHDFVI